MRPYFCLLTLLFIAGPTQAQAQAKAGADANLVEQGRRIYQEGILPSGAKLQGVRFSNAVVEGEEVACIKCHRRSGMGGLEGNTAVPPVSGPFLFAGKDRPLALLDTRSPRDITQAHDPYTESTLTRAVTEGTDINGKPMDVLMPRYKLTPADTEALIAYLRELSATPSAGLSEKTIRFATIVTPGVAPQRAEILQRMMRAAFHQRNYSERPRAGQMRMPLQLIPRERKDWELTVWELKGATETWGAQLLEYAKRDPVFAVVSGVTDESWSPVHAFCDSQRIPCLFPSVDHVEDSTSFYALYFSRGVVLEAEVLARHLTDAKSHRPERVVQIISDDAASRAAAVAFRRSLSASGMALEDRAYRPDAVKHALDGLNASETMVFWLRPADLAALAKAKPTLPVAKGYFSGRLTGIDASGVPAPWKSKARLVYPFETGEKRQANLKAVHQWLKTYNLPMVDETLQSEAFFNLLFLTDLTTQMLDNYYRDYLVERAEDMLSQGANVSAYPRLSLGTDQRFASKGAYIAHINAAGAIQPDTDWIIP